jgi:hypothetical protein
MPEWRNGRRSGFKIRRWQQRGGSSPFSGTIMTSPRTNILVHYTSELATHATNVKNKEICTQSAFNNLCDCQILVCFKIVSCLLKNLAYESVW